MNNSLVDDKIKELFVSYRTIAIVGVSADTNKDSNRIMKFLRNTGYKVFPINPHTDNKIINEANIKFVSNRCIKQDYQKIFLKSNPVFPVLKN